MGLATQFSASRGPCPLAGLSVAAWGDPQVFAFLPNSSPDPNFNPSAVLSGPVTVETGDGTVYKFPSFTHQAPTSPVSAGLASTIEDRNGNEITIADNNNGNFVVTDTAERKVISSDGFGGPINFLTIPGGAYKIVWDNTSPVQTSFSSPKPFWAGNSQGPDSPFDTCSLVPPALDSQIVITAIVLPNQETLQFHYGTDNANVLFRNNFGLLNEIDYPSGAWVKYVWQIPELNELADYPGAV